ncbi:MAG TPA: NPCBM/NEW2 domain-containing protein [Dongiaceae bacterium]|nr:NPCBM/NEW2 domain-containing protein [Dongiaceae bacterium]
MKRTTYAFGAALAATLLLGARPALHATTTYNLGDLDLATVQQDWGEPHANRSVDNHDLTLAGKKYPNGLGTHASSQFILTLDGTGEKFSARVGVDDEVGKGKGGVVFQVIGDGKALFTSGELHSGDEPQDVDVSLAGIKQLVLAVDGGADIGYDHADWANAVITMDSGKPAPLAPAQEPAVILTPKSGPKPKINSAKVFGVRPGAPFLFTVAANGDRPMTFAAANLPEGLKLDSASGQITGALTTPGEYVVTLSAKNGLGTAERTLKIVCGPTIGLTPALGWNSWNCFASAVTAEKVKAAADAMVRSGLINHGWTYINIDDFWEVHQDSKDPTLQGPHRDATGHIIPNPRFPDMKGLADYVHSKGLKIGLYSSPGPWTCGGCVASWQHETEDAESYAKWGFDYLKYDWCSYGGIAESGAPGLPPWNKNGDNLAAYQYPYRVMRAALDQQHRDILFSFCQYGMGDVWKWGKEVGGNSWRTTGDITDNWRSMSTIGFSQAGHEPYAGPGHFNDPDMLIVGKVGWGPELHPTRLTPNEQYTHISLWCLLTSPLLIGCDMTQLDDFTLSLLSNDEVLEVDQDPLAQQAKRVSQENQLEVWAKTMEDGSKAVGLFNRGYSDAQVTAKWSDLGLTGKQKVRDLWRQQDIGEFSDAFTASVPRHGVVLIRVWPVK